MLSPLESHMKLDMAQRAARQTGRQRGISSSGQAGSAQPCTIAFSIMQWMPLAPLTVWVTRRSAARLHSV